MNRKIIGIVAAGGLLLMAGAAFAQSASAQQSSPPYTSSTPQSTRNGMQGSPQNGMSGNGMNESMDRNGANNGAQSPPAFSTLDTQGHGYLTQQDASQNPWLGMHWAQCDADHDGKVTQAEYEACSQKQ